ncbi:MAG: YaeQ family protein [Candidatus Omnitrophota bacterium]|nr:YaeQ family protein [Candidatus Omnitrophota bacterium]MDZ4243220.1 YaeQ family protein [Candidatus Omnitrophota bacterium]
MDIQEHNKKYTFRFKNTKIVIGKTSHETEFQVFAKALVFALYHKEYPTLRVEAKVDERFQPDLSANAYDGTMVFWAECGNVSMNKVEKLFKKYRKAHYVFVKEQRDVPTFEKHMEKVAKEMHTLPVVDIVIYPEHFHEWNVSEEGDVYIRREDVDIIRWSS